MSMISLEPNFRIMENVIHKATKPLIRDFGEIELLQNSVKGPYKFAERALDRTNQILTDELKAKKSASKIYLNNKLVHNPSGEATSYSFWLYSIDGFKAFSRAHDDYAIIAILFDAQAKPLISLVNFPSLQTNFYAFSGSGSWYNKSYNTAQKRRRTRCSPVNEIENCFTTIQENCRELSYSGNYANFVNNSYGYDNSFSLSKVVFQCCLAKSDFGFIKGNLALLKAAELFIRESGGALHYIDQPENNLQDFEAKENTPAIWKNLQNSEEYRALLTNNAINKVLFKDKK